jgi:hypothetical protein
MDLFSILLSLETEDDIHLARLLILLGCFGGRKGVGTIEGLTKLAKLDFLLRYPVYLERALRAKGAPADRVEVQDYERRSVESTMVRFRYGPWDSRYRRFVNLLVAKGLAEVNIRGKAFEISLTSQGIQIANDLSNQEAFTDTSRRSKLLKRYFDQKGTTLMRFIYKAFPEIGTLRWGEDITL